MPHLTPDVLWSASCEQASDPHRSLTFLLDLQRMMCLIKFPIEGVGFKILSLMGNFTPMPFLASFCVTYCGEKYILIVVLQSDGILRSSQQSVFCDASEFAEIGGTHQASNRTHCVQDDQATVTWFSTFAQGVLPPQHSEKLNEKCNCVGS